MKTRVARLWEAPVVYVYKKAAFDHTLAPVQNVLKNVIAAYLLYYDCKRRHTTFWIVEQRSRALLESFLCSGQLERKNILYEHF